jgi:uncharacterized protein YgiB involved in biofilm formation
MKRSANLRLTLMAAAIPVVIAGCEPAPPTGQVLASVSECDYQTDVDPQQCRAEYEKARAEHERVAPRFDSNSACNDQFGQCTAVTTERGQTNWIPPMTGFLLGYVAGDLMNRGGGGGYYRVGGSSPLYRDYRSGDYLKPSGDIASDRTGKVTGKAGNTSPPARAITVSRSGFGSSSAARSSFGGSRGFGG